MGVDDILSGLVSGGSNFGADISGALPSSAPFRRAIEAIRGQVENELQTQANALSAAADRLAVAWEAPPAIPHFQGRVAATYATEMSDSFATIRNQTVEPTRSAARALRSSAGNMGHRA
jgi:hypothetical protein